MHLEIKQCHHKGWQDRGQPCSRGFRLFQNLLHDAQHKLLHCSSSAHADLVKLLTQSAGRHRAVHPPINVWPAQYHLHQAQRSGFCSQSDCWPTSGCGTTFWGAQLKLGDSPAPQRSGEEVVSISQSVLSVTGVGLWAFWILSCQNLSLYKPACSFKHCLFFSFYIYTHFRILNRSIFGYYFHPEKKKKKT